MTHTAATQRVATGIAFAALVATQTAVQPARAAVVPPTAISINAKLPMVRERLPIFRLTRTAAPTSLVASLLATTKDAPLTMKGTQMVAHTAHGALRAYVDGLRGDAEIFPDLRATAPAHAALVRGELERAASNVFARGDMIPKDATTARIGSETPVFGQGKTRGTSALRAARSAPRRLFTYVTALRYAHGLPVVGNGSHATVAVAEDGSIRGMVRRWQAAGAAGTIAPTTTAAQLVASIDGQLKRFENPHTRITVDRIVTAYYDGGGNFLQPVYTFLATMHGGKFDDHVTGYVPVGKLAEAIPAIGGVQGPAPSTAIHGRLRGLGGRVHTDDNGYVMQLGEYANDDGTMLDMANAYNNGFTANSPWWAPAISRTQWYWAAPGDYVGTSNQYANSVDVAYTNPHGDWWINSTSGTGGAAFTIGQIGTNENPGYGAAAGGILSTWIIDSCEVIPSSYDLAVTTGDGNNAFTPWFPVFQGLHRALGFRTQMLLGQDGMNWQIAYDQAQGADAVSAFFNDVAAVDFNGIYGTYFNSHLGYNVNFDRVSVMVDDRNNGESIYATAPQSAAGTLDNYWMGD